MRWSVDRTNPWALLVPSATSASAWVTATRAPLKDLCALKNSAEAWSLLRAKYRRGESALSSRTTDSNCTRDGSGEYNKERFLPDVLGAPVIRMEFGSLLPHL